MDDLLDKIPEAIAEVAFETLLENQPTAIFAIKGLLDAGETSTTIYAAVLRMSQGNQFIAGLFSHAAEYIVQHPESVVDTQVGGV